MLVGMVVSVVLVIGTVVLFYEVLRLTSNHLADLPVPPRARIIVVVLASFAGHTAVVWIYAGAFWLLDYWELGELGGVPVEGFGDHLYFSVTAYTSLGFGDHVPLAASRLVAGVEALNGLTLIGWSASFTYLAMERYWPMHGKGRG